VLGPQVASALNRAPGGRVQHDRLFGGPRTDQHCAAQAEAEAFLLSLLSFAFQAEQFARLVEHSLGIDAHQNPVLALGHNQRVELVRSLRYEDEKQAKLAPFGSNPAEFIADEQSEAPMRIGGNNIVRFIDEK
jgi:hypothetical protein